MGIGNNTIDLLVELRKAGLLRRRSAVMEIGAQQLASSFLEASDRLAWLGSLFGIADRLILPTPRPSHIVHGELEHLEAAAPSARHFWTWLGFHYASIDIDGSPGSIPLDLNYDTPPPEAIGHYDVVTNFGTTEHLTNQLNAFKVIHDLTAPGGLMIHELPSQGMLNHGLFNYNFKFFWMLGRSNGYKFIDSEFAVSKEYYELPSNIYSFLEANNPKAAMQWHDYRTADAGMRIVLQKRFDIPFVAPIDVPTGTQTSITSLKERYWTVFGLSQFDGLAVYDRVRFRPPNRNSHHR